MNELTEIFIAVCSPLLKEAHMPPHTFAVAKNSESAFIDFPAVEDDGFDVNLAVNALEIILGGGDLWHRHMQPVSNSRALVEKAFGQTRTLLCPDARLIEKYSDGRLYSATMEEYNGRQWQSGKAITLIFWNYFGTRTKKTLINEHLPGIASL